MVFQYQIVIFFCVISVYTVCHVDHYVKVHQVQKKFFWLITANSASGHSFKYPPCVLVMTYSLPT